METFTALYEEKMIPAYEKSWPGWTPYLLRRIWSEKADGFALHRLAHLLIAVA
jgi:hypothetical protein